MSYAIISGMSVFDTIDELLVQKEPIKVILCKRGENPIRASVWPERIEKSKMDYGIEIEGEISFSEGEDLKPFRAFLNRNGEDILKIEDDALDLNF